MNKILRLPEVIKVTGLPRTTIYYFMKNGRFPNSISLSARLVGWLESDVQDWISSKIESSN